tara:strand:- start:3009 stop:3779 length:771 start_codon:yes stop_codon:yes gene_type:complete
MSTTAVNLGAGGFVSYFEDGGAAVSLDDTYSTEPQEVVVEPEYEETGFFPAIYDNLKDTSISMDQIRNSGRSNQERSEFYYPEGGPTFFETLAEDFNYPTEADGGIKPLMGRNRFEVPRSDLPKTQELEDARGHMLASALAASKYGPETAESLGDFKEDFFFIGSNAPNAIMDKRNNAVGIDIFKKAGMGATPAELTKMVDSQIFDQLNTILGRSLEDQDAPDSQPRWRKNFKSPPTGPDLYFPRRESGKFISDGF